MHTYLHITQEDAEKMLETNNFTGAQVVPLPDMSTAMINQDKAIIARTPKKLEQWVPKLTMEIYLQDQQ